VPEATAETASSLLLSSQ